jgi:hypothetical protein
MLPLMWNIFLTFSIISRLDNCCDKLGSLHLHSLDKASPYFYYIIQWQIDSMKLWDVIIAASKMNRIMQSLFLSSRLFYQDMNVDKSNEWFYCHNWVQELKEKNVRIIFLCRQTAIQSWWEQISEMGVNEKVLLTKPFVYVFRKTLTFVVFRFSLRLCF